MKKLWRLIFVALGLVGIMFLFYNAGSVDGIDTAFAEAQIEVEILRGQLDFTRGKLDSAWVITDRFYAALYGPAIKKLCEVEIAKTAAYARVAGAADSAYDRGYVAGVIAAVNGEVDAARFRGEHHKPLIYQTNDWPGFRDTVQWRSR